MAYESTWMRVLLWMVVFARPFGSMLVATLPS